MSTVWEQANEFFSEISLDYALEIIEDALAHGFEFKVEDGKLYFTETE